MAGTLVRNSIPFLILAALAALGLWSIARGLRGRRIGDHPTCARCDFDLRGAPSDSTRCPECGNDTTARNAVRIGVRRRRPWLVAIGLLWFLIPTLAVVTELKRIDWRSHLPTWYVLYEARSGSPASRVVPIDQLLARDRRKRLGADDRLALAQAILVMQGGPTRFWDANWGDFVAQRLIEGSLPDPDSDAFVNNLFADSTVTLRTRLAPGGVMPVQVILDGTRRGMTTNGLLVSRFDSSSRTLVIDGTPVQHSGLRLDTNMPFDSGRGCLYPVETGLPWQELALGPHHVEWTCEMILRVACPGGGPPGAELARRSLRWRGTVEVVEPGELVRLVPDPTKADAIRASFTNTKIELSTSDGNAALQFRVGRLPADVAFDFFAKQGDAAEQRLATLTRAANASTSGYYLGLPTVSLRPGTVTLILRPSPAAAAETVDLLDIWDGEIRIDDVPVIESK